VDTTFGQGPPPKIWEGKKRLKFGAISDNYRLRSRISPERIHISKIGKVADQLQPLPRWRRKDGELWSTKKQVRGVHIDHPGGISAPFQTTFHFDSPGGVAASGIWTTQDCLRSRTCGAGRPYVGLSPIFLVFYLFRRATSELPRPIAVKLCHMNGISCRFIMQVQKFGGHPPKKSGAKNMQNLARFQTTSNFDREYLRNWSRYPKSENVLFHSDSSRVPWKKSGKLWSTNYRELEVRLDVHKLHFSGDYISALRGCWPLKF